MKLNNWRLIFSLKNSYYTSYCYPKMNNFNIECVKLLKQLAIESNTWYGKPRRWKEVRKQKPKQVKRHQTKPKIIHTRWCSVEQNTWIHWWRWHLQNIHSVPGSVLCFTCMNWFNPYDSMFLMMIFLSVW